MIRCNSC